MEHTNLRAILLLENILENLVIQIHTTFSVDA